MNTANKYTSADLMRKQNARSILRVIHQENGIYRKMLAMRTNLAAQTVTNIITVLIDKGIVLEQPMNVEGKGRNPFALQINYAGFYIVSVQITDFAFDIYLNSLDARVLYEQHCDYDRETDMLAMLKAALADIYAAFSGSHTISAIVISVAGIVDEKKGVVIEAYSLKWHGLDLRAELSGLQTPVLVLNDVNIIAHYENSISEDNMNFMVVKVEDGVGSALVLDRHVVYSSNRVSGEFGHVTAFKPEESVECFCGRTNCITQFISKGSLKRRLQKSYAQIQEDVRRGEPETTQTIQEIGHLVAPKLLDLIVLLDLDRVILIGQVIEDFQDIIYPRIQEAIDKNLSFWVPFSKLEVKKYDCLPRICSSYVMDHYFSSENELHFLWDTYL